jgi:hypothetical protein
MAIRQEPEPKFADRGCPGLNTQPQQTRLEFSRRSTPWPATWEPAPVQLAVVMFSSHGTVIRNQFYSSAISGRQQPTGAPRRFRNPSTATSSKTKSWSLPGMAWSWSYSTRPIEHAAGRGNRCGLPPFDGAYLLDGRHGLARDERWRTAPSPKSGWRSTPFIYL